MSNAKIRTFELDEGEKATAVMAYTANMLAWGEVITRESMRVSTWLRTPAAPQYLTLHDAHVRFQSATGIGRMQSFAALHLPSSQIIAFHLIPPARDPVDYEENEPHRKMEPVTALVGAFRLDGLIRMSTQTNLERYLDVAKETFTTFYEVEITQPGEAQMGTLRVPYVLLRRDSILFSPRC